AVDVIEVVQRAMEEHGKPAYIRSDNGPEFIAYAIGDWLRRERSELERCSYRTPLEHAAEEKNRVRGGRAPPNPAPLTAAGVRGEQGANAPARPTRPTTLTNN